METIIPFLFSFSLPSLTTPQLPPNTMQVRKTKRGVKTIGVKISPQEGKPEPLQ
jgi:hypothetical protein